MKFSLIVCTYQRPEALLTLLESVKEQSLYPDQILIIDGSEDHRTQKIMESQTFWNLEYFKVVAEHRGLTRQRNFGISKLNKASEVVCFLDDDTLLKKNYFEQLLKTYEKYPEAVGVGGYIIEENFWRKVSEDHQPGKGEYISEGWARPEGARFQLRRKFGLAPDAPPGIMPDFSHGYSIGFLPPTGKTYKVEFFMGGVASYKTDLFRKIKFSEYFQGYGLYEDMDFCLRASRIGQLYLNTSAGLYHHHEEGGRPNQFKYGKMVVRNGWYVWRMKYPKPSLKNRIKWYATSLLLALIRLGNAISEREKKKALTEALGRIWALMFMSRKFN